MKLSTIAFASIIGSSSAFVAPRTIATPSAVFMADVEETEVTEEVAFEEPAPALPEMSMSMPFMKRPAALTGEFIWFCVDFCTMNEPLM